MIALASDCLLFELTGGETVPFSAANMSVEVSGDNAALFDSEFVRHAANAPPRERWIASEPLPFFNEVEE